MDLREIAKQPSVLELPKQQVSFIISQRFNLQTYDYLAITDDPFAPVWIPSHLANNYYPELVRDYYKKHTDLSESLFVPHAYFYRNGKLVSIFHYPSGDFYTEKIATQPLPIQLPQRSADFGKADSIEVAAAKTLIFAYPGGKATKENAKIYQRLAYYSVYPVDGEFYSAWGIDVDVIMLVVEYYRFKGKDKLCLFGFNNYYSICSELYKYGIFASRIHGDDVNCCIIDDPNDPNLNCAYEAVIAAAPCEIKAKRRFLILPHAEYQQRFASFLFPGVQDGESLRYLFSSTELGYISNIFCLDNSIYSFLTLNLHTSRYPTALGSSAYVFSYQPSLAEMARVKAFLDTDIVAQRFIGDNKTRKEKIATKSAVAHLNFAFHTLGGILRALWVSSGYGRELYEATERMTLLDYFLASARFFYFQRALVVAPDEVCYAVQRHLSASGSYEVSTSLFGQTPPQPQPQQRQQLPRFAVCVLAESDIYALALTLYQFPYALNKECFPQFAMCPFTSTRQIEVLLEYIYTAAGAQAPCVISVVAEGTVEEQLMVYRQQLSCYCYQEFAQLQENMQQPSHGARAEQYYAHICALIYYCGFDGNYCAQTQQYDYAKLGIMQQMNDNYALCDQFCKATVNRFNYNEMIVYASLQGLFGINKAFNIHVLAYIIYGSKFESAHRSAYVYQYSAMSFLELQQLEKAAPYYYLEQIYSYYYLCNTNFDKGMQIYNNNQFPSIMNQQTVLEQVNKYVGNASAQSAQQLIEMFLKTAKEHKISDFHSYNVKPQKSVIKQYCYLPLVKLPFTNNYSYSQIQAFYRNYPLEKPVTLCSDCVLFAKQKPYFFARNCDMCEKPMESVADDSLFYRYSGNSNNLMRIGYYIENFDYNVTYPIDFILNSNLCAVSYTGGVRWDNLVLRGAEIDVLENHYEYFEQLLRYDRQDGSVERLIQALNLLDRTRVYSFADLYYGFSCENQFTAASINYALADYVIRNNGVLTNEQMNSFEYVPIEKILRRIVHFELFTQRNQVLQHHDFGAVVNHAKYCANFYDSTCQLLSGACAHAKDFAEFVKFTIAYYKEIKLTSLTQRFSYQASYNFIEALVKCYLKERDYGMEFSQDLISISTFYTKCLAFDNLLIQNIMSYIMHFGPKSSVFNYIKITMKHFMTQEVIYHTNLFALHRYYSQLVKSISSNGSSSFVASEQIASVLEQARVQSSAECLNKLHLQGFNLVNFLSGPSNLDCDIRVYNSDISGSAVTEVFKRPVQRKFMLNQQAYKVSYSVPYTPRHALQGLQGAQALQNPYMLQTVQGPHSLHSSQAYQAVYSMRYPSFGYISSNQANQIGQLVARQSGQISQFNQANQAMMGAAYTAKPANTRGMSRVASENAQQIKLGSDANFAAANRAAMQQPKVLQTPLLSHVNTQQNFQIFYQTFESTIKTLLTISIVPLIRRLSDHFYPFALYSKKNILYVPQVRQIQATEMLNQLFNQFSHKEFIGTEDPNFYPMVQILAKDFSMQHGQGKLYRYIRNDYKQKLVEIINKSVPNTMWYYDHCQMLLYHLIKRYILCAADFNKELFYVFCQDPAMGTFETENMPGKTSQMRYYMTADVIFDFQKQQVMQLYEKCCAFCSKQPDVPMILNNLLKIGLNIGSTPLDIYKYFFMGKQDQITLQKIQTIQNLYMLLLVCYHFKLKFPFTINDRQVDYEYLGFLLHRYQTIKLVTMKIQSQSYITYLQTIANLQQATAEDKRDIQDIIIRHTTYNEDIILSDKSQTDKLAYIKAYALVIEQMNQFQMALDLKYARFYCADTPGLQFKQQNFDKFALNELDKCKLRKAYIYACQYKMLFLATFGLYSQAINNFRLTKQITQSQFDCIIDLYTNILNIWSRFHDYIFYICMTECGYENTFERIKSSENKRQYFEPLRSSLIYKDLPIEQSSLYQFYQGIIAKIPYQSNQPFLYNDLYGSAPKYPQFSQYASYFHSPTLQYILYACQSIGSPDMFPINSYPFDYTFCLMRQKQLISALFYERILYSDPLQTKIVDPNVDLFGEMPAYSYNFTFPIKDIEEKRPTLVDRKMTCSPARDIKVQQNSGPQTPQGHGRHNKPQMRNQAFIPEEVQYKVENQPLDYYKAPPEQTDKFVREIVRACIGEINIDIEQILFINSSCQKDKADIWGKLYSFLIKETPIPLEKLNEDSKRLFENIKKYAIDNLHIDRGVANQALFDQIEQKFYRLPQSQKTIFNEIDKLILQFIELQLDIAYFHAFYLRDDFIQGTVNLKTKKEQIHKALQSIQIMNKGPLNKLMQQPGAENKRKMALATFIFLNNGGKQ